MSARSPRRRLALGAAICLLALGAAWALLQATAAGSEAARVVLSGPVSELRLEVPAGDLSLRAGPTDGVRADTRLRHFLMRPERRLTRAGDRAELRYGCRFWTSCAVDVDAVVPATSALAARTPFGDIRVSGLAGALDLQTRTGEISGEDLRAAHADVESTSGDVRLGFAAAPSEVAVTTTSGDVTLTVPAGRYRVTAESTAGSVRLRGVVDDPAAARRLSVESDAGDVFVTGEEAA